MFSSTFGTQFQPLYFLLLKLVLPFKHSLLALRVPSLAASLLTMVGATAAAWSISDRKAALLVSLLFAINPTQIYYANEIRYYSLETALLVWSFAFALWSQFSPKKGNLLSFFSGIAAGLSLLTATFSLFWAVLIGLFVTGFPSRRPRRDTLLSWLSGAFPFFLFFACDQVSFVRALAHLPPLHGTFRTITPRTLLGWGKHTLFGPIALDASLSRNFVGLAVVTLFALFLYASRFLTRGIRESRWDRLFLLALVCAPWGFFFLGDLLLGGMYQHRYLLPSEVFLLIVLGTMLRTNFARGVLLLLVIVSAFLFLPLYFSSATAYEHFFPYPVTHSRDFYLPNDLRDLREKIPENETIVFDAIEPFLFWDVFRQGNQPYYLLRPPYSPHIWSYIKSVPERRWLAAGEPPPGVLHFTIVTSAPARFPKAVITNTWKGFSILRLEAHPETE
ncbi:MAG: hypothetical protein D6679_05605 [Candidatus Hydrogenedentota bacterium]|nr:MAG: hypothetical protein D6679_05605 [Candidatus Hydrogenedentota bacterium]